MSECELDGEYFSSILSLLNVNIKFGSQQESIPVPPTPPTVRSQPPDVSTSGGLGAVQ